MSIPPKTIEAGVAAFNEAVSAGCEVDDVVAAVYKAMEKAKPKARDWPRDGLVQALKHFDVEVEDLARAWASVTRNSCIIVEGGHCSVAWADGDESGSGCKDLNDG